MEGSEDVSLMLGEDKGIVCVGEVGGGEGGLHHLSWII